MESVNLANEESADSIANEKRVSLRVLMLRMWMSLIYCVLSKRNRASALLLVQRTARVPPWAERVATIVKVEVTQARLLRVLEQLSERMT